MHWVKKKVDMRQMSEFVHWGLFIGVCSLGFVRWGLFVGVCSLGFVHWGLFIGVCSLGTPFSRKKQPSKITAEFIMAE